MRRKIDNVCFRKESSFMLVECAQCDPWCNDGKFAVRENILVLIKIIKEYMI